MQLIEDDTPEAIFCRQALMRSCNLATEAELTVALEALSPLPSYAVLRAPETGLVMVRGRIGGNGQAFNAGEVTITRAAVRLESGEAGSGYVLGRSSAKALMTALVDALGQRQNLRELLETALSQPVARRLAGENAQQEAETAATRVNFFTLLRGED